MSISKAILVMSRKKEKKSQIIIRFTAPLIISKFPANKLWQILSC